MTFETLRKMKIMITRPQEDCGVCIPRYEKDTVHESRAQMRNGAKGLKEVGLGYGMTVTGGLVCAPDCSTLQTHRDILNVEIVFGEIGSDVSRVLY